MTKFIEDAQIAIEEPEVQEILQRLSKYGLGVFVPHMHTEEEEFAELPIGFVQVETNLKVSFLPESEATGVPVGWRWNEKNMVASRCSRCYKDEKGSHHKTSIECG